MIKLPEKNKLSTLALSDPLSKETEVKRAHLMFAACASILLTVYGLKINKTPWLDIEVPQGAPNILQGALSVAVLYTLLIFLVHAWTDFTRWWIAREVIEVSGYKFAIERLQAHVSGMTHLLSAPERYDNYTDAQKVDAAKSQAHASEHLERLLAEIRQLQKRHNALSVTQFLRLSVVDIGVPVLLGGVALAKIGSAIGPFLASIVQ